VASTFPKGGRHVAVSENAVEMPQHGLGDRAERRQALPSEGAGPGREEAPRCPLKV
jgi:hypothetical protein